VVSARLHLEVGGENAGAMVTMSPILEGWIEGSQSGSPGVANFTQRTATENWTTAGVQTPGSASATIVTFPAPTAPTIVSVDLPVATIRLGRRRYNLSDGARRRRQRGLERGDHGHLAPRARGHLLPLRSWTQLQQPMYVK
jgi:hypothetical protein